MDIQSFIEEFKKNFVYGMLSQTLTDEQLFDYFVMDNGDIVFSKEQMRQMWSMWQAAKASVPEGFVLVEINDLTTVLSNCSDAMMDESTSSVYDETGEPSTWFDHHVVAEGNLLLAIGKAHEPSND